MLTLDCRLFYKHKLVKKLQPDSNPGLEKQYLSKLPKVHEDEILSRFLVKDNDDYASLSCLLLDQLVIN